MGETGKKGSGKENPKVQLGHVTFETAAGGGVRQGHRCAYRVLGFRGAVQSGDTNWGVVLVSQGGLKQQKLIVSRSGGCKSRMKVLSGPCGLRSF